MRCSRVTFCRLEIHRQLEVYLRHYSCGSHSSAAIPSAVAATPVPLVLKPTFLVSACLLGEPVTYRGESIKPRNPCCTPIGFIVDFLWRRCGLIDCIAVCPEMDVLGMPSPRPPLRLVRDAATGQRSALSSDVAVRLPLTPFTDNWTDDSGLKQRLTLRDPRLVEELLQKRLMGVDGCVLKSRSPSCGAGDARLYNNVAGGKYLKTDGFFVESFIRPFRSDGEAPLPVVTEKSLYFDDDKGQTRKNEAKKSCNCGVLAFLNSALKRHEARKGNSALVSHRYPY
ncbi:hypothetical protein, conserved [Trypanosoma brucei gambiense DAL972]|uniref:Uncharacterized protein n=2 Tax=Trypanosoma brucei TaxID=5691 RepID=D0A737_TRYB9|nr:hypothetical protein, conserved [Trypanosoma brucei gambiense DAL972]RHW67060.1 hypothetical protein DPX39_000050800 [Trypanosoma brucei equiperdum]CBH17488.1 hypothetical protein, conserved [Trypanosoma brucei gambiense DAL972]|eukprot:XP_011779752.1 hypothetical protein, conserved [Trypanosoma brucei gambiense DAL972]